MGKLKRYLKFILSGIVLNYVTPSLSFFISQNFFAKDNINITSVKNSKFNFKKNMNIEDYLCLASAYTHIASKKNKTLRKSNCEDYARATLKVFNYLTEKNNKPELQSRVKLISGLVKIDSMFGHEWIEFQDRHGVNRVFDPYYDTPPYLDANKLKGYCNLNSHNFNPLWKIEYKFTSSNEGIALPSSQLLTYPYGLAGILYVLISNADDYIEIYFSKNR